MAKTTIRRVKVRGEYRTEVREGGRLLASKKWKPGDVKRARSTLVKTVLTPFRVPDKRIRRVQVVFGSSYVQGDIRSATIRVVVQTRHPEKFQIEDLRRIAVETIDALRLPLGDLEAVEDRDISTQEIQGATERIRTIVHLIKKNGKTYTYER